jgi:hypothetical protein
MDNENHSSQVIRYVTNALSRRGVSVPVVPTPSDDKTELNRSLVNMFPPAEIANPLFPRRDNGNIDLPVA